MGERALKESSRKSGREKEKDGEREGGRKFFPLRGIRSGGRRGREGGREGMGDEERSKAAVALSFLVDGRSGKE